MKQLNDEFNLFRSLFPLKVYIGGPPASGKTYFSKSLASSYGIPHLMIADMIKNASGKDDELGDLIRKTVEELKDAKVAEYEKTRKKKDPDLDRATIQVRLPDEILQQIVKVYLASPACMNKGFILDGYPRNVKDAEAVFMDVKTETEPQPADMPAEEQNNLVLIEKIIPQFCIVFDAENDFLKQRVQQLPKTEVEGTHFTDPHMERRLKVYREQNQNAASEKNILKFFSQHISANNCMTLNGPDSDNVKDSLSKMQGLLEKNGKPCCLNLITESDNKFLAKLAKEKRIQDELLAEQ